MPRPALPAAAQHCPLSWQHEDTHGEPTASGVMLRAVALRSLGHVDPRWSWSKARHGLHRPCLSGHSAASKQPALCAVCHVSAAAKG